VEYGIARFIAADPPAVENDEDDWSRRQSLSDSRAVAHRSSLTGLSLPGIVMGDPDNRLCVDKGRQGKQAPPIVPARTLSARPRAPPIAFEDSDMTTETRIDEATYERLALAEPDRKWELRDGYLLEKPPMTSAHNWIGIKLGYMLMAQLDWATYQARVDAGRLRRPEATYYIPDVFVVPTAFVIPLLDQQDTLEMFDQPLPLVVEVWSRSTGGYDVAEKLAGYQGRGDLEIWRIHPYERTLTTWVRQPDGTYEETVYREGIVHPAALPGVAIDLGKLFDN
jgi:Uma2 family endonuclease